MMTRFASGLALFLTVATPHAAFADGDRVRTPRVPADIQVPAGNKPFFVAHAVGTQGYFCVPSDSGSAWLAFGPQATLYNDDDEQILTHFLSSNPLETSPSPYESGLQRPTWQTSRDTSAVWAKQSAKSTDANFVAPGAIPWLLLQIVGYRPGPDGGDKLAPATFIQRLNTVAGSAPAGACVVGDKVLVPYEADYFFYRKDQGHGRHDD